jgi:Flp pilus assembly pilin Flp
MKGLLVQVQRGEDGQTMAEYAVVLAMILLLAVGALTLLSGVIGPAIDNARSLI